MAHVFEPAPSGRARCRGCGQPIAKDELRFGERLPNPFGEGEMTLWFHLPCGAFRRPEPFLEALATTEQRIAGAERLAADARQGVDHRRLPRLAGAGRAPTGRARCRCCREPIDKGLWRCPLVFYEGGRFQPSGFVHVRCSREYFDTIDILSRIRHFSPELGPGDLEEIRSELEGGRAPTDAVD